MLSLTELERAVRILAPRAAGARLERFLQTDDFTLVLAVQGSGNVVLSCDPELARISVAESVQAPDSPLHFAQFLKAHVSDGRVRAVQVTGHERQAAVLLDAQGEKLELLLSLLGARSNLYLLDGARTLLYALRPLEQTRRELEIGGPWRDPPGGPPRAGTDRWAAEPDERYLVAIEETYRRAAERRGAAELARRAHEALKKELEFFDRKIARLETDLAGAEDPEEIRGKGELLKGVLHQVRFGDSRAEAADFATGAHVTIELDPKLTPAANLEDYFERYHREVRRREALGEQLRAAAAARASLGLLQLELQTLATAEPLDRGALDEFAARPAVRKLIGRSAAAPRAPRRPERRKPDMPARLLPKRYRSADGLEIWVGRSDEGNDYMTTRLARGNDLFLHLEGSPGSHVILRTEGRTDPPAESILEACELAVHFSKHKGATRADVHVSPVKNVKKPSGAKPGLVYVARGKTVHLRRDGKRLERVMASRIED
jgi:predicted ribosome quality control (RQC) complex YloA/Tae2 family protein